MNLTFDAFDALGMMTENIDNVQLSLAINQRYAIRPRLVDGESNLDVEKLRNDRGYIIKAAQWVVFTRASGSFYSAKNRLSDFQIDVWPTMSEAIQGRAEIEEYERAYLLPNHPAARFGRPPPAPRAEAGRYGLNREARAAAGPRTATPLPWLQKAALKFEGIPNLFKWLILLAIMTLTNTALIQAASAAQTLSIREENGPMFRKLVWVMSQLMEMHFASNNETMTAIREALGSLPTSCPVSIKHEF